MQKVVFVHPSRMSEERRARLEKSGFPFVVVKNKSTSYGFEYENKCPSDMTVFFENYVFDEEAGREILHNLSFMLLGTSKIPDIKFYSKNVKAVVFSGHISSIRTAFSITRELLSCSKVTFVLGREEQCPLLDSGDYNPVIDLVTIPHVRDLSLIFQPYERMDKKRMDVVTIQVKNVLRLGTCLYPKLEEVTIDLPCASWLSPVQEALKRWKTLRYDYDVQFVNKRVRLYVINQEKLNSSASSVTSSRASVSPLKEKRTRIKAKDVVEESPESPTQEEPKESTPIKRTSFPENEEFVEEKRAKKGSYEEELIPIIPVERIPKQVKRKNKKEREEYEEKVHQGRYKKFSNNKRHQQQKEFHDPRELPENYHNGHNDRSHSHQFSKSKENETGKTYYEEWLYSKNYEIKSEPESDPESEEFEYYKPNSKVPPPLPITSHQRSKQSEVRIPPTTSRMTTPPVKGFQQMVAMDEMYERRERNLLFSTEDGNTLSISADLIEAVAQSKSKSFN